MKRELLHTLQGLEEEYASKYLPHISIDCVVLGYHDRNLKVLLLKMKDLDQWSLPGGFVEHDMEIQAAAEKTLLDRTGASNIFLRQFKTYGSPCRTSDIYADMPEELWFKQRFISIGYYALVDYEDVEPQLDDVSQYCEWKDIRKLPQLMMDHRSMVEDALILLRKDLNYRPIGLNLLPEKFTMPELQSLYEIILGKKLNRGNFYRKILNYNILVKLDETRKGGAHKSPDLYTFDEVNYKEAHEEGFKASW